MLKAGHNTPEGHKYKNLVFEIGPDDYVSHVESKWNQEYIVYFGISTYRNKKFEVKCEKGIRKDKIFN